LTQGQPCVINFLEARKKASKSHAVEYKRHCGAGRKIC
jgi:hypothetical protein